nr:rep protein [Cressdnaviricota sp.]
MVRVAKNWCWTFHGEVGEDGHTHGYSVHDVQRISALPCPPIVYLIGGYELGEDGETPHIQGFVHFDKRYSAHFVKKFLSGRDGSTIHVEIMSKNSTVEKSVTYCKKENRGFFEVGSLENVSKQGKRSDLQSFMADVKAGMKRMVDIREKHPEVYAKYKTFCREYVSDHLPKPEVEEHPLKPWQQRLWDRLEEEPECRKVIFVVDFIGNQGKTWFARYYCNKKENASVILPGKKADMAYVLDPLSRVIFVDAPRSKQGDFIQYDFLEEVKNGYVFSSKYESEIKKFGNVHLVVMMNEQPDRTKLSMDRYEIIEIEHNDI